MAAMAGGIESTAPAQGRHRVFRGSRKKAGQAALNQNYVSVNTQACRTVPVVANADTAALVALLLRRIGRRRAADNQHPARRPARCPGTV